MTASAADRELARRNAELVALHETALALLEHRGLENVLQLLVERLASLVPTEYAVIFLVHALGDPLSPVAAFRTTAPSQDAWLRPGTSVVDRVVETGETFVVNDYAAWPERSDTAPAGLTAAAGLALKLNERLIGVIGVGLADGRRFEEAEVAALERFARLASVVVAGARAAEEFRRQAELLEDANVFVRGLDGTITYWTRGAERLYGWTNEEAVGRISNELIRTEFPRPLPEIEAALAQKGRWEGELVHTCKDGSRVIVASLWVLRRDAEGNAFEVFEVDNDVTAARAAERFSAQVLTNVGHGVVIYDLDLRCVVWNRFMEELMGVPARDAVGKHAREVSPILTHGEAIAPFERALAGEYIDLKDYAFQTANSSTVWVWVSLAPLRDASGEIAGVISTVRDVTDRRLAEDSERKQRELAETIAAASQALTQELDLGAVLETTLEYLERLVPYDSASVMLLDETGRLAVRAARGYGTSIDEAAMKRLAFDVSMSPYLRPLVQERRSVLVGDTTKAKGWVLLPGIEHVRSWIGVPLIVGGETLGAYSIDKVEAGFFTAEHVARAEMLAAHGAFAIENARLHEELLRRAAELEARVVDGTQKAVAARADAERANRAKSEFLSRVSHDLRTPLNAILGFGQLLQLDGLDAEQEDSVGQIQRAGHHLLELIDEILDISRIETEQLGLASEQVDLAAAIAEAIELIRPLAAERSIRLRGPSRRRAPALVMADSQRLLQILLNLLGNAVSYTPSRGQVVVSCRRRGGRFRVGVSDTGPGIAEEDRAKLFEPFERLASSEGTEGTGLGLALVKRLTEAMGGRVGYEAVPAGGSLFWFDLPRWVPDGATPDARSAVRNPGGGHHARWGARSWGYE